MISTIAERVASMQTPNHIAIIMDGNGRWAEQRGLERIKGHLEGATALEKVAEFAADELKLPYLTLFAFSTENWNRPESEVQALMDLFFEYLKKEPDELVKRDVRLRFIGNLEDLPEKVRSEIQNAIRQTESKSGLCLTVAISYSGRQEILHATQRVLDALEAGEISPEAVEQLDEDSFRSFFYDPELPDPDIVIRTGGEQRLSNFFLWQSANTFFWSTPTYWPDFDESSLVEAIEAYAAHPTIKI